jgi:acyl-CoA reductase-like NAD-dependent aldehyde dehydrogenase
MEAGLPPGVFNVVTGTAAPIGEVFTNDPDIAKISFTGSTRVGAMLAGQAMGRVKRVSLELGGNAPFIVFDDADLEAAVRGHLPRSSAMRGKPVSVPIASWCRRMFMTALPPCWPNG